MNNFELLKDKIEGMIASISKNPTEETTYSVLSDLLEYAEILSDGKDESTTWISIKDKQPETYDYVAVLLADKYPALGQYSNNIWEAQALGSQHLNLVDGVHVTHWLYEPDRNKV